MLKTGDNVRFLNIVGGGIIRRIDAKQGLVFVEDTDGFEIPVLEIECVVLPKTSPTTNIPLSENSSLNENISEENKEEIEVVETEYGDNPLIFLTFFAKNLRELQNTDYECYLVNDSNYYLYFNLAKKQNNNSLLIKDGKIEPNFQGKIADIQKTEINEWENIHVQIIAYKIDKPFNLQKAMDLYVKIPPVNFFKFHSFSQNDYFDSPAMLINLTELIEKEKLANISAENLHQAMQTKKTDRQRIAKHISKKGKAEIIEIDLHINALLDTTKGMTNGQILEYQLNKLHSTLEQYKNNRGQRIVFIHGKGEGILRAEIEKQLKTRYKTYYFQDASFQKYGFGATMVMIR
ncbi:MAG: DUF2027 domain-containing protein [Paludibacter sp.]|nr:DUF2027 domain-containing protein [Paludibacter sp.]